jgi:hypothetical protein
VQYRFHEGTVPRGYRLGYEPSLFNFEAHRKLQALKGWCSFLILDDAGGVVCGAMHVHVQGTLAESPLRSPFGSIEFSEDLPVEILKAFIKFVQEGLMAKGVERLKIKSYPEAYVPYHAQLLKTCLLDLTYAVLFSETSSVVNVTELPPQASFHRSEKKRLRKCLNSGMEFRQLKLDQLEHVYNFIRLCREEKQYKLSMTYGSLEYHVSPLIIFYSAYSRMTTWWRLPSLCGRVKRFFTIFTMPMPGRLINSAPSFCW